MAAVSGFFEEVKRRKVYRVAVGYVVAAGGIIQLASAAFPAWELPNWTLRLVIVLLLIGFPIALILAWAFDVTPQGIRATPKTELSRPSHRRRNIAVLCALGVLISATAGFFLLPRAAARKLEKSIAVLPFESFSDDKESAFFADGIQDDILTSLAKIGDLKVISRTSVMPYRGKTGNVREIGKALGVSAVLEGSVRKDKNRVRINVQLINAANDEHIWAEDYDRDLTDVFAIQTDLAQKIANELQAKLSPSEKALMTRKPTENGEAYLAFVEGHNLATNLEELSKMQQAEQLFERAIKLDPNFALAYAAQSRVQSWIYHNYEVTPERRDRSRDLARRALQLQPNLPEAHLALGFYYYYGERNYDSALRELSVAQDGLPNSAEVYLAMGAIQRRQGRWNESTTNLEKAATLDPNSTWPLQNLAFNYQMMRDYPAAIRTVDRALQIDPASLTLWSLKAQFAIAGSGDFSVTSRALEELKSRPALAGTPHAILARAGALALQRNFAEAARELESIPDNAFAADPARLSAKYFSLGVARLETGEQAAGRAALTRAREIVEGLLRGAPDDAKMHCELAEILALLGEKDGAIAEATRATQLQPESSDAFEGVVATEALAHVYANVGEPDKAIDLIEHLLTRPSDITTFTLKVDPVWDEIRNHPRFQQLIEKYSAKA